jgi:hypothetical protein
MHKMAADQTPELASAYRSPVITQRGTAAVAEQSSARRHGKGQSGQ